MENIIFTAHFGDQAKQVEISEPHGGASDSYYVYIERFYFGCIVKYKGEWVWHHNNPDFFTSDDIQILSGMINQELNKV